MLAAPFLGLVAVASSVAGGVWAAPSAKRAQVQTLVVGHPGVLNYSTTPGYQGPSGSPLSFDSTTVGTQAKVSKIVRPLHSLHPLRAQGKILKTQLIRGLGRRRTHPTLRLYPLALLTSEPKPSLPMKEERLPEFSV